MLCFIWDFEERSQDKQVEHKDTELELTGSASSNKTPQMLQL